jgi:anthranilate synthase component 1
VEEIMQLEIQTPIETARPNLIPVVRQLPADLETPVSVYMKLAGVEPSFLLESVTGGEQVARYSFIGVNPTHAYLLRGERLERRSLQDGVTVEIGGGQDPLEVLREEMSRRRPASRPKGSFLRSGGAEELHALPRFSGGLVGFLGYEVAGAFERSVPVLQGGAGEALPEAIFLQADTVVAFDHAFGRLLLIVNVPLDPESTEPEGAALAEGERLLDRLEERLAQPLPPAAASMAEAPEAALRSNTTHTEFIQAVERAKEHIAAGDIFQVVLSQRFTRPTSASPFSIYRALRRLNPSPYMFFFDFAGLAGSEPLHLIGASPEMHVRLENGGETRRAAIRPIAGTRPRGRTPEEDQANGEDLLADPKERAEHIMLVDLARNDLGRVCEYGSVSTPELMLIERYSHVMHIVSQVEGQLRAEFDGFDLMRATFPAGTVSGAPKIRAMQIIFELEKAPRGPYAGAVGYFSYDGTLDTCITIRTLVMQGQVVHLQAGAGIVADSDPEREYQETLNKARALAVAVEMAEKA